MPVAIVTGANKGIGLSLISKLVLAYPRSDLCRRYDQAPLLVYLTARNRQRGAEAVKHVRSSELMASQEYGRLARVEFMELDVTDDGSVHKFTSDIAAAHDGVDVLINNAGVAPDGTDAQSARQTLDTNYHGTIRLTHALLPSLLTPHARIVNMSSMLGKLNKYSPALTTAFRAAAAAAPDTTTPDPTTPTTALMQSYLSAVEAGTPSDQGWPTSAYAVSKAGVTAATLAIAAREKAARPADARCINACCPGLIATDMTKGRGRSVDRGADMPALLALGDIGGVTGEFWERGEVGVW